MKNCQFRRIFSMNYVLVRFRDLKLKKVKYRDREITDTGRLLAFDVIRFLTQDCVDIFLTIILNVV